MTDRFCILARHVALAVLTAWLTSPALAESSSWSSQGAGKDAPAKPAAPKTSPAGATQKTVPAKPGTTDQKKTVPSLAPVTGEDAAYLAFDQGQYLTALKLAQEAASRGEPSAHTLIGRIYQEGLGVPKDEKAAANWYTRATELGDIPATFELALMLAQGRGVEKNREAAASLFEKAAMTGHALANYNLGLLFLKGDGKPENPYRATWCCRA